MGMGRTAKRSFRKGKIDDVERGDPKARGKKKMLRQDYVPPQNRGEKEIGVGHELGRRDSKRGGGRNVRRREERIPGNSGVKIHMTVGKGTECPKRSIGPLTEEVVGSRSSEERYVGSSEL